MRTATFPSNVGASSMHAVPRDHAIVAAFGGGARLHVSPCDGVRADLRLHLTENLIDTAVDARPVRRPGGTSSAIFVVATTADRLRPSRPSPSRCAGA